MSYDHGFDTLPLLYLQGCLQITVPNYHSLTV